MTTDSLNSRVSTGIAGLDKVIGGGIPQKNVVLISGGCGTGKSTFCLQYLLDGVKKKEKGLYISTEQTKEELFRAASLLGWNLEEYEKKKLLNILYFDVPNGADFLSKIYESASQFVPQRIAIDSLTTFTDSILISDDDNKPYTFTKIATTVSPVPMSEKIVVKRALYFLIRKLRLFNATVLLTSELPEKSDFLSADEVSEFICDGVIILRSLTVGETLSRNMEIKKMRYSSISAGTKSYELTSKGISVLAE